MNKNTSIIFMLITMNAYGTIYCIESKNIKAKINTPEKSQAGSITYQKGSGPIKIQLLKTEDKTDKDDDEAMSRPHQFDSTWIELGTAGKATGEYVVSTQGSSLISVEYLNYKKKSRLSFDPNENGTVSGRCW